MSELAQQTIDRFLDQQIQPRCIAQSWVYEPDVGNYLYRINWKYPHTYTLQRTLKLNTVQSDNLWNNHDAVQFWVNVDSGKFGFSSHRFPTFIFDSSAKARLIIRRELLNFADESLQKKVEV